VNIVASVEFLKFAVPLLGAAFAWLWNERRKRFECRSETHGLYWAWLYGDETSTNVLVISCFPLEDD
jgi:hypothetical protein